MNDARIRGELPEDEWPETEDVFTSDIEALELDEDVDDFADEAAVKPVPPPAAPPVDAPGFFDANADLHALDGLVLAGRPGVLERLGPAHFRSKGFSFMGFLQTVYDHVAGQVKRDAAGEAAAPSSPAEAAAESAAESKAESSPAGPRPD